jgi:hypothetical protein
MNKGKISWIYLHGIELEKKNTQGTWTRYWLCKQCYLTGSRKPMPNASTTSCSNHLQNQHNTYPVGRGPSAPTSTSRMDQYLYDEHPYLHAEHWQTSFINWIVVNDISFEAATDPLLHDVILRGGPTVKDLLPSRPTIRQWLITTYTERLIDVKESIANSRSKIVLSLDGWSAPNKLSLLGVVGHWLDKERNLKTALLGLRPIEGHAGNNIADVLRNVMETFELTTEKVSAYQMDNATNNDTALKALNSATTPQTRLRCLGHIINLVVKALLFGTTSATFQKELQSTSDEGAFTLWRKHGAIGRLHNLVTYITRNDRRMRDFEKSQRLVAGGNLARTLHLKRDFGVRWNSTYTMIQRALVLQKSLQRYCRDWRPIAGEVYDLKNDFLDAQDWEELRHFEELLQHFEKTTKRVEGNAYTGTHGALWEVIPTMDFLFAKLKKHSHEVEDSPELFSDYYTECLNHGFVKLSEYYTKIDESPYYAAAVALHPCKRFTYFDEIWSKTTGGVASIQTAKASTRRLFDDYLKRARAERESSTELDTLFIHDDNEDEDEDWATAFGEHTIDVERRTNTLQRRQESELNRFMDDELDVYYTEQLNGKLVTKSYVDQPLRWWRERGESLYPILATIAYDLFAMPGMSSECERAFSSAKRLITDERYSLKSDIIEADQCVKSWLKNGIVDGHAAFNNIGDFDGD